MHKSLNWIMRMCMAWFWNQDSRHTGQFHGVFGQIPTLLSHFFQGGLLAKHNQATHTTTNQNSPERQHTVGNAASAGLCSCLRDYNMICERVNTSWVKQRHRMPHSRGEEEATLGLKGGVNKINWRTQLFTLSHIFIRPTKINPNPFLKV